jgi:hypothetical protein
MKNHKFAVCPKNAAGPSPQVVEKDKMDVTEVMGADTLLQGMGKLNLYDEEGGCQ